MKLNFKPLSSFFSRKESEEKKGENEETQVGEDQVTDSDDQGEDQGEEKEDEQEQTGAEAKETSTVSKTKEISISAEEYKSFLSAQAELEKFGKNAEDRNSFLKDAAQLQAWYEAAAATGATSNSDANAQEKSTKKLSKVTQEAKAAYQKSASKK